MSDLNTETPIAGVTQAVVDAPQAPNATPISNEAPTVMTDMPAVNTSATSLGVDTLGTTTTSADAVVIPISNVNAAPTITQKDIEEADRKRQDEAFNKVIAQGRFEASANMARQANPGENVAQPAAKLVDTESTMSKAKDEWANTPQPEKEALLGQVSAIAAAEEARKAQPENLGFLAKIKAKLFGPHKNNTPSTSSPKTEDNQPAITTAEPQTAMSQGLAEPA